MRGTFSRNVVLPLCDESKDARIGPFVSPTLLSFAVRMTLRQQPDVIKLLNRLEICSRTYIAGVDDVDGFHARLSVCSIARARDLGPPVSR